MSQHEDLLAFHLKAAKIPFERQVRLCKHRKWKLDFLVAGILAVEVDGAIWVNGRHSRGAGITSDAEKLNQATLSGLKPLRFTGDHVKSGYALATIEAALKPPTTS